MPTTIPKMKATRNKITSVFKSTTIAHTPFYYRAKAPCAYAGSRPRSL